MSSNRIRFIAKISIASCIMVVAGCSTARMPKMNLAWWKKSETPKASHSEAIAAPSKTMSPVNSLVKAEETKSDSKPSRKPYEVERNATAGPPESRSFGLENMSVSKGNSMAGAATSPSSTASKAAGNSTPMAKSLTGPASGSASEKPTPRTGFELPKASETKLPDSMAARTNMPGSEQKASSDPTNATASPQRITNPFVNQPGNLASNTSNVQSTSATPEYPQTSYGSFVPKQPVAQATGQAVSSPVPLAGRNQLKPMPDPGSAGDAAMPIASQISNESATTTPNTTNASAVMQTKYTPGSIGASPSLTELLKSPVRTAESSSTSTEAPMKLGGGGSFKLTR